MSMVSAATRSQQRTKRKNEGVTVNSIRTVYHDYNLPTISLTSKSAYFCEFIFKRRAAESRMGRGD